MRKINCFIFMVAFLVGCNPAQSKKINEDLEIKKDYLNEGITQLKEKNLKEAMVSFYNAIKQDPNDVEPYLILGKIYMDGENFTEAIKHFEAAGKLQPDNGKIYLVLAKCYEKIHDMDNALISAKRSVLIFKAKNDTENYQTAMAIVGMLMRVSNQSEESGTL